MNVTEIASIFAIAASVASLLGVFYFGVVKLATLEVKVDTMWKFLWDRGSVEVVSRGWGQLRSPLVVNDDAKKLLAPLREPIIALYKELYSIDDETLALHIQQRLGDRILMEVCVPNRMEWGACLHIACAVAKDALLDKDN